MSKIHVLYVGKDQELFIDFYPLFFSSKKLCFYNVEPNSFFSDSLEEVIVVSRWYYLKYKEFFMSSNLEKYQRLFLYDSCDSADDFSKDIPECFKCILRKQLLKDKSFYNLKMIGGKFFSNWYYTNYAVQNIILKDREAHDDQRLIKKSRIFFNNLIGFHTNFILPFGKYLNRIIRFFIRRLYYFNFIGIIRLIFEFHRKFMVNSLKSEVNDDLKGYSPKLFARFGSSGFDKVVKFHRDHVLDHLTDLEFSRNVFIGSTNYKKYQSELKEGLNLFISPYGTGEICFRDIEILFHKNILVKPLMSHIETYPSIYEEILQYHLDLSDLNYTLGEIDMHKQMDILTRIRAELCYAYENIGSRVDDIL